MRINKLLWVIIVSHTFSRCWVLHWCNAKYHIVINEKNIREWKCTRKCTKWTWSWGSKCYRVLLKGHFISILKEIDPHFQLFKKVVNLAPIETKRFFLSSGGTFDQFWYYHKWYILSGYSRSISWIPFCVHGRFIFR